MRYRTPIAIEKQDSVPIGYKTVNQNHCCVQLDRGLTGLLKTNKYIYRERKLKSKYPVQRGH